MIRANLLEKQFGKIKAVNNVTLTIPDGVIFGLLGSNGAGKSTLLRMLAGILKQSKGDILIDGVPVFDNLEIKREIFFLSDKQYFFPNATTHTMSEFYKNIYPDFQMGRFEELCEEFGFDKIRKLRTFSKGMKKQVAILLALCASTNYILCDEVFDGLDPVVRQSVKTIFLEEVERRSLTLIIASHNL